MACYVGMARDLAVREQTHRANHPSLYDFKVLTGCLSYDEALEAEKNYAALHECTQHGGGPRANGCWYVYIFYY